jgi:hypothetical protein
MAQASPTRRKAKSPALDVQGYSGDGHRARRDARGCAVGAFILRPASDSSRGCLGKNMQTGEQALNSLHETIELQLAAHAETREWK